MFFETTLTRARIDEMHAAGHWLDAHLVDRFFADDGDPNRPLVIDELGTLRWDDAVGLVDTLAHSLLALGLGPGDVLQLQLPNRREFLLLVLAAERVGVVVNPIAPIFRTNEVAVMSRLAQPSAVVTVDSYRGFGLGEMHRELREAAEWVEQLVVIATDGGPGTPADALGWDQLIALGEASTVDDATIDLLRPGPHDVCEIIFTSGTTGQPKGVLHTQNTLNTAVRQWLARVAPGRRVFHMASTLAHQTGYLFGVRAPIMAAGMVVYQPVWDAAEFARLIEAHGIEVSMGATPFLADLLDVADLAERDLSSFSSFVCAGAAIPRPVLERARDALPCTVMPGWGMSETALSTTGYLDDPFDKRATDGAPLDGSEVRVVDESGAPLAAGVEGDLQYRGPMLFVGYLQGREFTEANFRDGWFDTGDRAVIDDDGYISISGRTKDIVIRGGENIPVKEVEDVLLRHPAVANVAVVAKPHDRLGEIGCAVVIASGDPPTLDELTAFLAEHGVTKQFWPEDLRLVDEFPMTPSGKIQKYQLRAAVLAED